MTSLHLHTLHPIKRPSLRATILNQVLRRYAKAPAERAPEGIEVNDEQLRRGAKRAAKMFKRNERLPRGVKLTPVSIPTPAGAMDAEWLETTQSALDKVILYFHGGGYFMCSAATHRPITYGLAQAAKRRVLSINYRMAPAHRFPSWLEDAVSAYRFLLEQGYAPEKIALGGDSAGGNLVLICLQQLRNEGLPLPGAAILISPWTDFAVEGTSIDGNNARDVMFSNKSMRAMARYLVSNQDAKNPLLSPVHADFSGFPPLLIQVGTTEILRDDSRRVAQAATAAGVSVRLEEWHNLPHVFHLFANYVPEGKRAIRHLGAFVREHC